MAYQNHGRAPLRTNGGIGASAWSSEPPSQQAGFGPEVPTGPRADRRMPGNVTTGAGNMAPFTTPRHQPANDLDTFLAGIAPYTSALQRAHINCAPCQASARSIEGAKRTMRACLIGKTITDEYASLVHQGLQLRVNVPRGQRCPRCPIISQEHEIVKFVEDFTKKCYTRNGYRRPMHGNVLEYKPFRNYGNEPLEGYAVYPPNVTMGQGTMNPTPSPSFGVAATASTDVTNIQGTIDAIVTANQGTLNANVTTNQGTMSTTPAPSDTTPAPSTTTNPSSPNLAASSEEPTVAELQDIVRQRERAAREASSETARIRGILAQQTEMRTAAERQVEERNDTIDQLRGEARAWGYERTQLTQRLERRDETILGLRTTIQENNARIAALELEAARVEGLQTTIREANARIAALEPQAARVEGLQTTIREANARIAALAPQAALVEGLETTIREKNARIAALEREASLVVGLQATIQQNNVRIAALEPVATRVPGLDAQIAEQTRRIADLAPQAARVEGLANQVADKNATLTEKDARIALLEPQAARVEGLVAQLAEQSTSLTEKDSQIAALQLEAARIQGFEAQIAERDVQIAERDSTITALQPKVARADELEPLCVVVQTRLNRSAPKPETETFPEFEVPRFEFPDFITQLPKISLWKLFLGILLVSSVLGPFFAGPLYSRLSSFSSTSDLLNLPENLPENQGLALNQCGWYYPYVSDPELATGLEIGCDLDSEELFRLLEEANQELVSDLANEDPANITVSAKIVSHVISAFDSPYKVAVWAVWGGVAYAGYHYLA